MAILMMMEWPGVTPAQYEEVKRITNFENEWPDGGKAHVAAFEDGVLKVVDIWDSAEQFQAFAESKLMEAAQQAGATSQPDVKILPAHNVFIPR